MQSMIKVGLILLATGATTGYAGGSSSVGTGFGGSTATADVVGDNVDLTITGDAAKTIYDQLNVQVTGPLATGACFPNQPCDPVTFYGKSGSGVSCAKMTYSVSGRIEYSCSLKINQDGDVSAE